MFAITRRTFVEGAAVLPGASIRIETQRKVGDIAGARTPSPRIFYSIGRTVYGDRLTQLCREHFAPASAEHVWEVRRTGAAAVWALAANGAGAALVPVRELVLGVLSGLPVVSIAQVGAGTDGRIAVSARGPSELAALDGAPLAARDESERDRWREIGASLQWKLGPPVFVPTTDPAKSVLNGAAAAMLVSSREQAVLEGRQAPLTYLRVEAHVRKPTLCLIAHRSCLHDDRSWSSVRRVVQLFNAAAHREALISAEPEASGDIAFPTARALDIEHDDMRAGLGATKGFGRHDRDGWDEHVRELIAARVPKGEPACQGVGFWSDDLLPYRANAALIRTARRDRPPLRAATSFTVPNPTRG